MKLGCASWGFRKMNLDEYFSTVLSLGLKYAEVECFNESETSNTIPTGFNAEDMKKLQKEWNEKGLKIASFAGGNDFTSPDDVAVEKDIEKIKKMIDIASAGGVEVIRLFAGFAQVEATEEVFEKVINNYKKVGYYAEQRGVILAMENHGGITRTAEQVKKLLDGIKIDSVGLNYDPANFHHYGVDPVDALEKLKDYIVYFHLKDSKFENQQHFYKAVGEGNIQWKPVFQWVEESYDGYCMIEYENPEDAAEGTKRSIDFLKTQGF
jgi:sugar phosphate isomerase/epimerase